MTEETRNDELQQNEELQAEESAAEEKKTEHVYVTDRLTEEQDALPVEEDSAGTEDESDEPETMESMLEMYGDGEEIQRGKVVQGTVVNAVDGG